MRSTYLKPGHVARKFFDLECRRDLNRAADLLMPGFPLIGAAPVYTNRDSWALAEAMSAVLVRYDFGGHSFAAVSQPLFRVAVLEHELNGVNRRSASCAARCLIDIARAHMQPSPAPDSDDALAGAFALAAADLFRKRGEWPAGFEQLFRAGGPLGGGVDYSPSPAELARLSEALQRLWLNVDGAAVFSDVREIVRQWVRTRSAATDLAKLTYVAADPTLQFGHLSRARLPDLCLEHAGKRALVEIHGTSGPVSPDDVKRLASAVLLAGRAFDPIDLVGIAYVRRAIVQLCPVDHLFRAMFSHPDRARLGERYRARLAEASNATGVT